MKILFVSDDLHRLGGTETYLCRLMHALAAHGIECWCLSGGQLVDGPFVHLLDPRIRRWHQLVEARRAVDEFRRLVEREAFDAIHVSNLHCPPLIEAILDHPRVARHVHDHRLFCPTGPKYHFDTRCVCTVSQGLVCFFKCLPASVIRINNLHFLGPGYLKYRKNLHLARMFPRVVVASQYMRRELEQVGFPPERIRVVPYFVPDRAPAPLDLPVRPPHVLYVGRMVEEKGVHVLLEALARSPGIQATIAGDGPKLEPLRRRAARWDLLSRVHFAGAVPNEQVPRLMEQAHAVVVPSIWPEPFGIVGIEAMAIGRATIASDVGGIGDWLDDGVTGRLVPPGQPQALAQALQQLLADSNRLGEMGRMAWERSVRYLPETHISQLLDAMGLAIRSEASGGIR